MIGKSPYKDRMYWGLVGDVELKWRKQGECRDVVFLLVTRTPTLVTGEEG